MRLLKLELDILKFVLLEYSTAQDTAVVITAKQIKLQQAILLHEYAYNMNMSVFEKSELGG